ncbi:possible sterol desaturase [alpha proteobacterium U9-1i]|nr:possible sterol desaturase [alpha proteobacterium U9-1i]
MIWLDQLAALAAPLLWPALGFAALALLARGLASLRTARAAAGEVRVNLTLYVFDALLIAPGLGLMAASLAAWLSAHGLMLVSAATWVNLPTLVVACITLVIGDFVGYWRHRLEHSPPLWPAHAVHHSDTAMTWTTLHRFHPINRLTTTMIDGTALALLGLPPWAVLANALTRHYYGMFIHMDLPWTFGPLGRVLVSPAMHRWHHVRDSAYAGKNFATLFSVFDQAFGTYHAPGPCAAPLGVPDDMGRGVLGQLLHPVKVAARLFRGYFSANARSARIEY